MLSVAFLAVLTGLGATALGMEPKVMALPSPSSSSFTPPHPPLHCPSFTLLSLSFPPPPPPCLAPLQTGWAVFAFGVATIVGFSVAYHWEQARVAGVSQRQVNQSTTPLLETFLPNICLPLTYIHHNIYLP